MYGSPCAVLCPIWGRFSRFEWCLTQTSLASCLSASTWDQESTSVQVLLGLLGSRPGLAAAHVDRLRALAARVLLGLARDPSIRHILAKLQARF